MCALDKTKMHDGRPFTPLCHDIGAKYGPVLQSNLDGKRLPPPGSPIYLMAIGNTNPMINIYMWKLYLKGNSLTGPFSIPVEAVTRAPEKYVVPQPGGTFLENISDRLLFRLTYRNFGNHESIVATHSVDNGYGLPAIRFYEFRDLSKKGNKVTVYQQGTFNPGDQVSRWMQR